MQKLLADPDPAVAKRVMDAVLQMVKIDIATLEKARDRELVG
jgi:predicted 3-demethylubiquinone-9 3-methyltransferase (glyoxalase superfamily)